MEVHTANFTVEGCHYGEPTIESNQLLQFHSIVSNKKIFDLQLNQVASCVVPANNRDEIEVQFVDPMEKSDHNRQEDALVQITFHFPSGEDDEGLTNAELFRKKILNTGVIRSETGDIIAEFSKEQGNFVTPRGKYAIQLTKTHMRMQGVQYAYNIKYNDINSLFLLPKLDSGRSSFVISLEKPIRQGNQKYQNLVIETTKLEHTMTINLSQDEINQKYEGQLETEMTLPICNLLAKVFKVLSGKKVYVPKQFLSNQNFHAVRCSLKANDGLLYPLAKSFIFTNKPTVIIKFDDIEYVEFKRITTTDYATRNFDLMVSVKSQSMNAGDSKEYIFLSIDKAEYSLLFDYLQARKITIKNPQEMAVKAGIPGLQDMDDDDEDEDEDGDYQSEDGKKEEEENSDDDDDEGSEEEGGENVKTSKKSSEPRGGEKKEKKNKKTNADDEGGDEVVKKKMKKSSNETNPEEPTGGKKARPKKDKNAPKGALSSYLLFSMEERKAVAKENPQLSMTEISKFIGTKWKSMSNDQKQPYEELAKADKERYAKQLKEYKAGTFIPAPVVKKSSKGGKPSIKKEDGKVVMDVDADENDDDEGDADEAIDVDDN